VNDSREIGVLLLNLGGPGSIRAVRPFLYNLFSDRTIIRLGPAFMQKPLAGLISTLRAPKAAEMYRQIGGKSPLLEFTAAQAEALRRGLDGPWRVLIGMRYWHPFISEALEEARSRGINKLIVLSLYPHYSLATTGSSLIKLKEDIKAYPMSYGVVQEWYRHPLYIEALADTIKKAAARFEGKDVFVLFSAHAVPRKLIDMGDPYLEQIEGTISAVSEKIPFEHALSFQSRIGPVKWLEPSTEGMLRELAGSGVKNIVVTPVSFVSDHLETLYEIDILYKGLAAKLGLGLERAEALNTHPLLIKALVELVRAKRKELGWQG
jgi:ferrochelatase